MREIIKFLSAKSYNDYQIIDENNCLVNINQNEKVIIPNSLLYSFINVCVPYNNVIAECISMFMNDYNIILDESINLNNPNVFGALLISSENSDLFKEWHQFKNELLNEECMYINLNDRINILAQYLSLDESFDINQILQLESLEEFDYESNIGSFNQLYSLLEDIVQIGEYNNVEDAKKAAEKYAKSQIPWWRKLGLVMAGTSQRSYNIKSEPKEFFSVNYETPQGKVLNRKDTFKIEKRDGKIILDYMTNSNNQRSNNKLNKESTGWDVTKDISKRVGSKIVNVAKNEGKVLINLSKDGYNLGKKGYDAITSDTSKRFFKNSAAALGKASKAVGGATQKLGKATYNFVTDKKVQDTAKKLGKAILKPNIETTRALSRGFERFGRFVGNTAQDMTKGLNGRPLSV